MYVSVHHSSFIMKVLTKVLCFESRPPIILTSPPLLSSRCERLLARLFVALFREDDAVSQTYEFDPNFELRPERRAGETVSLKPRRMGKGAEHDACNERLADGAFVHSTN